jgi:hypothetical protein
VAKHNSISYFRRKITVWAKTTRTTKRRPLTRAEIKSIAAKFAQGMAA